MAKFCGGFKVGAGLKLDEKTNSILCTSSAQGDVSDTVSTCGQMWNADEFMIAAVSNKKIITRKGDDGKVVGTPEFGKGVCGVGLDSRFFAVTNNEITMDDSFKLYVNATPADATVAVVVGSTTKDKLPGGYYKMDALNSEYTVTVSKTGYTTQTQKVKAEKDTTLNITLVEQA